MRLASFVFVGPDPALPLVLTREGLVVTDPSVARPNNRRLASSLEH